LVTLGLRQLLRNPPNSVEDLEVFEPRLLAVELEEEALLVTAKLKIVEAQRTIKRVEGWRKADQRRKGAAATK
jgi:hypothetical protein